MFDFSGVRVVLADSNPASRDCIRDVLRGEADIQIVGQAHDGAEAVDVVGELAPDVLVVDTDMPDLPGTEVVRRVVAASAVVKVLAVSLHADSRFAIRTLASGAFGYVLKNRVVDDLAAAVRVVASGRTYVSPGIAGIAAGTGAGDLQVGEEGSEKRQGRVGHSAPEG